MKWTILAISFLAHSAWGSGGMDGGGGQGILCDLGNGKRSLKSLDLYEARHIWGYDIPKSLSLREEFERVYPNYQLYQEMRVSPRRIGPPPPDSSETIESTFKALVTHEFNQRLISIPPGSHLTLSPDSGNRLLQPPPNCRWVQVLFYVDENIEGGKILVDQEYWNLLSPQDQLAFIFHESIYKWVRGFFGVKNSDSVRKVVALLFRKGRYPAVVGPTYGQERLKSCWAEGGDIHGMGVGFYLVPFNINEEGRPDLRMARLVFSNIDDDPVLVETTFDSIWDFDKWIGGKPFDTSGYVSWSKSALGSKRMSLGFTDPQCIGKKKECVPKLEIQDKDGKWTGGVISCRDYR